MPTYIRLTDYKSSEEKEKGFSPRSHALRGNAYSNRRKIDWVGTDIKFMNQHTRTS